MSDVAFHRLPGKDAPKVRETVEANGTVTRTDKGKAFAYNEGWTDERIVALLSLELPYLNANHVKRLRANEYPATVRPTKAPAAPDVTREEFVKLVASHNALCDLLSRLHNIAAPRDLMVTL